MNLREPSSALSFTPNSDERIFLDNHRFVNNQGEQRRHKFHSYIIRHILPAHEIAQTIDTDTVIDESKKAMRQFREPLRRRLYLDKSSLPTPIEISQDIEAIYGESVELLDTLDHHYHQSLSPQDKAQCRGMRSEILVFSLLARDMTGEECDKYTAIPSTIEEDIQPIRQHSRQGYDCRLIYRESGDTLKLQVKTSNRGAQKYRYDSTITMVSVEEIAGNSEQVQPLIDALVSEVDGSDFDEEIVKKSQERLHLILSKGQLIS